MHPQVTVEGVTAPVVGLHTRTDIRPGELTQAAHDKFALPIHALGEQATPKLSDVAAGAAMVCSWQLFAATAG